LVDLKACVPKLCVLLYSVVLSCVAACLMCHCSKLRFVNLISIKAYYYYYYYYYYSRSLKVVRNDIVEYGVCKFLLRQYLCLSVFLSLFFITMDLVV